MNEGTISTTENAEATKEAAETISEYYETILDSAEKWHSVNKNYIETQDELKEKQQQVRDEINKLTTEALPGYQQKVEDLEIKYQDLGTQIDETAEKHRQRLGEMQYDLLMTSLSTDGLTDAEYEMGVAAGIAFGVFDQEAADAMIAQKAINDAVEDGTLDFDIYKTAIKNAMKDGVVSADELKRILDNIPKNVDINLNVRTNYSVAGQVALTQQIAGEKDYIPTFGGGKASGGPVSAGKMYEVNEQGIPELLDFGGRQFLMMPGGGNGYVTPLSGGAGGSAGGMGGGQTLIQLVINSPVTIMDEEKAVNTLIPLLEQAWNELNSRGNV
jgi:hypothetical protein